MPQPNIRLEKKVSLDASSRSDPKRSALFVTSFEKGMRVLETISKVGQSLSLADVAEEAGLDKSAAQRFTHTLHALGYLYKDPLTRRYSLGPKVLDFGSVHRRSDELLIRAMPILTKFNSTYGETIGLARLDGPHVVYLVRLPGVNSAGVDIAFSSRVPVQCSAVGQAILSFMPQDKVKQLLTRPSVEAYGIHAVTGFEELAHRMAEIRERGFAVNYQGSIADEISIAAPVSNHAGSVVAAVGITLSRDRWTVDRARQELGPVIVRLSRRISNLGPSLEEGDEC